MPGIFGFHALQRSPTPGSLLTDMAAAMQPGPGEITGLHTHESIHLGSLQLRSARPAPQPAWNADHTIAAVLAGEIFGYAGLQADLRQRGCTIAEGNAAQFIACVYQEHGEDFIHRLNGAFAIAIWDERQRKLLLANDRLGYEPLYYTQTAERLAFASNTASLLADPHLPRTVNHLALAQLLTFDHVLGNHTFLQQVQLLPPGSLLSVTDGQVSRRTYWQLTFPDNYPVRKERAYQEELLSLLRQAMARQKPDQPAGILLSGGLDSRVVLALLTEKPSSTPLRAFTFGNADCDDLRYARELAAKTHTPHQYHPLRPSYLIEQAEKGIRLTDGMENVVHMHTLDNLAAQAAQADIFYKGFLGDALAGYFSYRDLLARYTTEDTIQFFFERYPIVFQPAVHAQLFQPGVLAQVQEGLLASARDEFMPPGMCTLASDLFFQFDLRQRQRRLTLNGVRLVRSQATVRTPFYDNDLLDFMLRVPQGYRLERYLIIQTFIAAFPELAKVPSTANGYPMMPCFRELFMRLNESLRWRLRAAGLKRLSVPQKRHYASYNLWFRGALRSWAEGILLSERGLGRGLFNPAYIRQLVAEQMAGQNHYQKLGALIAIELWHRQFID